VVWWMEGFATLGTGPPACFESKSYHTEDVVVNLDIPAAPKGNLRVPPMAVMDATSLCRTFTP
jgi:hypothetical protein